MAIVNKIELINAAKDCLPVIINLIITDITDTWIIFNKSNFFIAHLQIPIRAIRFSDTYDLCFQERSFDVELLLKVELLLEVDLLFELQLLIEVKYY